MIGLTLKLVRVGTAVIVLLALAFSVGLLNFIFVQVDLAEAFCTLVGALAVGGIEAVRAVAEWTGSARCLARSSRF